MSARRPVLAAVVAALLGAGVAACGDDERSTATVVQDPTTAVEPTTVPTTTTQTPTATTGEPVGGGHPQGSQTTPAPDTGGTPAGGEQGEGGGGDEEAVRTPVALTARAGALSPTTVTVPAFLALEIRITGAATTATLPGGGKLAVPGTRSVAGLKPGTYDITTADGGKATLNVVSGGDPGP